ATLLDRLQRSLGLVRPEHLRADLAALLGLPGDGALPESRRHHPPLAAAPTPQLSQDGEIAQVGGGLGLLGRLQHFGPPREAPVVEQEPDRCQTERAAADVLVAIEARAERRLGIVEVKRKHALESHGGLALCHRAAVAGLGADVVAGREEMTGVEAHAQTLGPGGTLEQGAELAERAA